MYSLVVLMCVVGGGPCQVFAPNVVFSNLAGCDEAIHIVRRENAAAVREGRIPPILETYRCVSWGTPL